MTNLVEIMDVAINLNLTLKSVNAFAQGNVVTEAHTKMCAQVGHGNWTKDGELLPDCPRCGQLAR